MLTAEQIELRKKGIGSSDIARILYFDKWQVWAEKTGRSDGVPMNAAMRRGDALEPVIAEIYAERMGLEPAQWAKGDTVVDGWKIATPDFITFEGDPVPTDGGMILECKAPGFRSGWGEEWTDDIPEHVIVQVQWQMDIMRRHALAGKDFCRVGAMVGNDHLVYEVGYDQKLIDRLEDVAEKFWRCNVLADIPPTVDESEGAKRYLDKRYPTNSAKLLAPTEQTIAWVTQLRAINEDIETFKKSKNRVENLIKEIMCDAQEIEGLCTWKTDKNGKRRFRLIKED